MSKESAWILGWTICMYIKVYVLVYILCTGTIFLRYRNAIPQKDKENEHRYYQNIAIKSQNVTTIVCCALQNIENVLCIIINLVNW